VIFKRFLLSGLCLLSMSAYAGPTLASVQQGAQPVRSKAGGTAAPLSDTERYARRCQPRAHLRERNPQGIMLWGMRRDWDTERVAPETSSVLISVALAPMKGVGAQVKTLQLKGGSLEVSPAGTKVAGMVLQGSSSDGEPVEVTICGAESSPQSPEMVWYRIEAWNPVAQEWENPCVATDRVPSPRALAVSGVWDLTGARKDLLDRFTFACENGAISKCIGWGYKPWASRDGKPLTELHQACTRMARADYCGDGRSHTYQDNIIDMYDQFGVLTRTPEGSADWDPTLTFEAAWGPEGALCMEHTRNGSALETVLAECPNRFRKGMAVDLGDGDRCSVQRANRDPKIALLRNKSHEVAQVAALPTPTVERSRLAGLSRR
jgi:ADYC domain-containing protein